MVLQLNQSSQFRCGDAGLHTAGAGKSGKSYYSHSMFVEIYYLLQAAVVDTCLHRGTLCITVSELGALFYSAGSSLFAQKTAVLWDQILVSLHVDPQQKMEISAAVAHCSFFETGLMTV